jgi:putative membrane protein
MWIRRVGVTLAALAAVACGGGGDANQDTGALAASGDTVAAAAVSTPAGDPGLTDPNILAMIGAANAAEIAAGEAASQKATNADVKAFAQMMVTDHRAMQGQADSLATALSLTPAPPQPAGDSAQQATRAASDSLAAAARGAAFDQMYMDQQVAAHRKTLDDLNRFASLTQNAQLQHLIHGAIPKVQQHFDRATQIRSSLGGS